MLPGRHFTGCASDSEVSRLQEMQGMRGGVSSLGNDYQYSYCSARGFDNISPHPTGHSLCGITTYSMLLNSYRLPSHLKLYYTSNLRKSACKDPFPFSKSARHWASFGPESHPSSFSSRSLLVVHNVHFRLHTAILLNKYLHLYFMCYISGLHLL